MKLLLVRHGETVDNVARKHAGITDSALTSHGRTQAVYLGQHLISPAKADLAFTHIFSSDLQRAAITAQAILSAQHDRQKIATANPTNGLEPTDVLQLPELREVDFGSLEGTLILEPPPPSGPDFRHQESRESMIIRANIFLDTYLFPLPASSTVAVVSHGIFLSVLWSVLFSRFSPENVSTLAGSGWSVGRRVTWSNTGYLVLEILGDENPINWKLNGLKCIISGMNVRTHLAELKRTRGGLGSAKFDDKQKTIDGFLSPREPSNQSM